MKIESESDGQKENIVDARKQNDLVVDIAFEIVQEVAPNEKQLFDAYKKVFLKNQGAPFKKRSKKDELLGFGTGESITMLTPFILNIITEIIKFIIENTKKSIKDKKTTEDINVIVKSTFKKYQDEKVKPNSLTSEQALAIRKMIIAKGKQMKISDDRVKILADSVVGGLIIKLS